MRLFHSSDMAISTATDPRLLYHSRTGFRQEQLIPVAEVCAEDPGMGHCALVPVNMETTGERGELFYQTYVATIRKENITEKSDV